MTLESLRQAIGWRTLAIVAGLGVGMALVGPAVFATSVVVGTADGSGTIASGEYAGQAFTVHLSGAYSGFGVGTLTTGAGTIVQIGSERFEAIVSPAFGTFQSLCCGEGDAFVDSFSMTGQVRHVTAGVPHNHLFGASAHTDGSMCFNIVDQSGSIVTPTEPPHDPGIGPICSPGATVTIGARVPGDLDGNATADLVWRQTQTGDVSAWRMFGVNPLPGSLAFGVPLAWQIVGVGDVDGDGLSDLVWRQTQTGDVAVWWAFLTNGLLNMNPGSIVASGVPLAWQIVEVGDLDGDGKADLVWRHTQTGDVAVWLMNGATVKQGPVVAAGVPLAWQIAGLGDVDGDAKADLVWRHSQTGHVAAWLMNGTTVKQGPVVAAGVPLAWQIAGVGDLDADGKADLVWRHTQTGDVAAWLMNGATVTQAPIVAFGVPLAWQIGKLEDVDGDGKVDLVWRQTQSGDVAVWLMDGVTVKQGPVVSAGVPLAWQIQR